MSKPRFTFKDIQIGDTIITTTNEIGIVIAIKSYAYLNDKMLRKADGSMIAQMKPFKFDDEQHKDIWYSTLTIAVMDNADLNNPSYYLEAIDFIEIKDIVKLTKTKLTFKEKIKKCINIWHN